MGPDRKVEDATEIPSAEAEYVAGKNTTDRQILQWERRRRKIFFESSLDGFRKLSDTVIGELSRDNLLRYVLSFQHWKDQEKRKDQPSSSGIKVEPVASSADLRMQVDFRDPKFHDEWHECWIRPDERRERSYRGYVPVEAEEVEVFCSTPAGPPAITDGQGRVEMLLYKITNEQLAANKKARKEQFDEPLKRDKERVREEVNKLAKEASPEAPDSVFLDPDKPEGLSGSVKWHEEPGESAADEE